MTTEEESKLYNEMIIIGKLLKKAINCKNWKAVEFLCDEYSEVREEYMRV